MEMEDKGRGIETEGRNERGKFKEDGTEFKQGERWREMEIGWRGREEKVKVKSKQ